MKQKLYSLFLTALLGMMGMNTWADELTTTEIDGITYYEINDAAGLVAFAELVSGGEYGANAVLTADIDLTYVNETFGVWETPIGGASGAFTGIFDGRGHSITNFEGESMGKYGLFGYIKDATVKNFSISGHLTAYSADGEKSNGAGAIGWSEGSHVINVHSALEIETAEPNVAHVGGVVGSAQGGNFIKGCSFSGTLKEELSNNDCFGGVVGYMGGDTIVFCANYGSVSFTYSDTYVGGIVGYLNSASGVVKNCLNTGKLEYLETEGEPAYGGAIVGRWRNASAQIESNYWLEGSALRGTGELSTASVASVTEVQLASGEVCYLLNGDQSVIGWFQNLNEDEWPTLEATHKQVYMNGRLHCNGTPYEGAVYSNQDTGMTQDDHDFVDGFCSYCGLFNENFLTPNADGFYEIATAKQLVWFEKKANQGEITANAILTADIDFADLMPEGSDPEETFVEWTAIGDWHTGAVSSAYQGHFNGQGHTIKNFNVTSSHNYYGVFGVVSAGSLIENFDIYGTLNLGHKTGGVVGYTRDATCTIRNIHSFLTLNVTEATVTAERPGGILGTAHNGTTIVENCTYSGTLNVGERTGNIGGIVGYINNSSSAIVYITNCLFDGEVKNAGEADGQCGGIVGYNNGGKATIKNCLSVGSVVSSDGNIGQFIGRLNGSNTVFENNYYMGEFVNGTASGKQAGGSEPVNVTEQELESGEVAWKLNGETFIDPVWHQTIGENKYPLPYPGEAVIYQTSDGYDCINPDDPTSVASFIDNVIENEEEFIETTVAYQTLLNEYEKEVKSWKEIDNFEAFLAAYTASAELKESVKASAANYAAYKQACETTAAYIEENSLEGTWVDFLKTYLEENIAPCNDYPNGSSAYILENGNLDDAAILSEIEFVNQMLANALAGGVTAGTEVTRLLSNPTFSAGFEGWTEEHDGGSSDVAGNTDIMPIPEAYNNNSSNAYQTLTEVPNGIYMMKLNGLFRAGTDVTSQFYAGQLYLNGTANYFMSPGEDVVLADNAEPGVNCLGEGGDAQYMMDDVDGWVPKSRNGCSVAFSAGRYLNYCATEVTDGTLTIGMRNLGTGLAKDWMPFGGLHVYYLGTAEEANEKLTDVLKDFRNRAEVICNFAWSEDQEAVAQYPNISEDLKGKLAEAIETVDDATDAAGEAINLSGEEKMKLIETFSDLFNQTHACRKAYIAMMEAANSLYDFLDGLLNADLISQDEYDEWETKIFDAIEHYTLGDISAEQANSIYTDLTSANLVMTPVDGVYQLATAEDVKVFSVLVNMGITDAKAVLTADIDMTDVIEEGFEPIGRNISATAGSPDYTYAFRGEFDGQGHKITGFGQYVEEEGGEGYYTLTLSGDAQGFFGLTRDAVIKNFSIDGAFEYNGGTGYGAIGWAYGTTIINVHSSLKMSSASTSHHIGGICGDMRTGSKAIRCSFSGSILDSHSSHDCIAGIGGYSNENCSYENCANYGTVTYTASNAYAGGICGYVNNDNFIGIFKCLNVGQVGMESGTPSYGGAFVGRLRGHANSKFENNFWLKDSAPNATGENAISATAVTTDQLLSGEVCYKLNGDQEEINWFQTLGEDENPVLFDSSLIVYVTENGFYTNEKPSTSPMGSKDNPFVVKTAADLAGLLNKLVSGQMNYVVMEEDVDMTGVTDWTPLFNIPDQSNGYPYIDFDGKNHVIRNLTSNTTGAYDYCGVFGVLCGNVRNLGVENATVECAGGTGILAGYLGHSTYGRPCFIENVWVTGKVTANGYCGGLFGNIADESHITNCYANVEVNGTSDYTGGIIGRVRNKVVMNNVYAAGSSNHGGIIGGGFQAATPEGSYTNVAVWNNTENNFGPARDTDAMSGILYYNGSNFADLQAQVVAWDPAVWSCDMQPGSYPVLSAFDPDGIRGIMADEGKQAQGIYNLAGQRLGKMQKGINIVNGKKVLY